MASVKISELNEMLVVTTADYIPIVDSESGTTQRVAFNVLNAWLDSYGSASHAKNADVATTATSASYVVSASWARTCLSASYAATASYFDLGGYIPPSALSASHALTASCLQGQGTSWENNLQISSSLILSSSAYMMIPRKVNVDTEDIRNNSIIFSPNGNGNDWTRIYYAENVADSGRMVFEHGDNVDALIPLGPNLDTYGRNSAGFLWQTLDTGGSYPFATGSLMFLKTDGNLFLRSATARNFTASVEGEGFHGTASWATNLVGGIGSQAIVPPVGSIMDYAGTGAPAGPDATNWRLCDGSELSQALYPVLYALLGTTWGAAGAGNFKLPNLNGRMTLGSNGGYTRISGSVGNTGGGEHLQTHYHMIGKSIKDITTNSGPDGGTSDDNIYLWWVKPKTINTKAAPDPAGQVPITPSGNNRLRRLFSLNGDGGFSQNPREDYGVASTPTDANWVLGSTYGISETGNDMMPPYAVVRKIIRIQ
jgi:microcystin-dependent protein